MNVDPFTGQAIHQQGIWSKSHCLESEHAILRDLEQAVASHGYKRSSSNLRLWQRGNHKIIICLVDDVRSASLDYETDTPYLFDRDTLVITDNHFACPTVFSVLTLPQSFFGIYSHDSLIEWQPDRSFCFSVNRLDDRRLRLMLELAKRAQLPEGYINFNCQTRYLSAHQAQPMADLQQNFRDAYAMLESFEAEKYRGPFNMLEGIMPYRNYDVAHDDIHSRSYCNIVVESYGSDNTVALSEKIFRVLALPVPWTLYGGRYAVAYLESLGFDCMSDVINHNHYDNLKEVEDKAHVFIWFSLKFARELSTVGHAHLQDRCQMACQHNQQLLRIWQARWPQDWSQWLIDLNSTLSSL